MYNMMEQCMMERCGTKNKNNILRWHVLAPQVIS